MQGNLIVRIFVHGLLLLAPKYDAVPGKETVVDLLSVFLVDARKGEHALDPHTPMLIFCDKAGAGGEYCKSATEIELALDDEFEQLGVQWIRRTPSDPWEPRRVELNDWAGSINKPFPARPPSSGKAEGSDFDWILSLSDALSQADPLQVRDDCQHQDDPHGEGCDIVARVSFSEGEVGTCKFVAAPKGRGGAVPSISIVAPSSGFQRAMAEIVMIELTRPLSKVEALEIRRGDGKKLRIGPNGDVEDRCAGDNFCADLAITNLPGELGWSGEGKHFRALYHLVNMPDGPQLHPYPMIVWRAPSKAPNEVHRDCPMPPSFFEAGKFKLVGKKGFFARLLGWVPPTSIQNRPICPPGTL